MVILVGHLPCIECHGSGRVTGDSACESCGGKGYMEVRGGLLDGYTIDGETHSGNLFQLGEENVTVTTGVVTDEEGRETATKLSVEDLTEFLHQHDLMDKPYNVTITPSLSSFLDAVVDQINLDGELPVGVSEIEREKVSGFRTLYGFDFVTQASKLGEDEGPKDLVVGTRYGSLLVLGSPSLPDGTFYIQHLVGVDGGEQDIEGETVNAQSLRAGHFRIRHFFANIYDYTSSLWPDGWYRMRKETRIDEVTYVREGRTSRGQGMPLVWATNLPHGEAYTFEQVTVLDVFDWAIVKEALRTILAPWSSEASEVWNGETEWENVKEAIERILGQ